MKEKEGAPQRENNSKREQKFEKEPITSDSVKNAHASGDGALGRSKGSIPGEDELDEEGKPQRKGREQY